MAQHPIRFGVQTGQQDVTWAEVLEAWQKADAWGYDSLWAYDHFYPIFTDPEGPCLGEAFVCQMVAMMRQTTPEAARAQIMIGERQECLDTIARYAAAGVTHFIFMLFAPYRVDELQAFAEEVIPAVRGHA